jgi:hypothetical protein
VESVVLDGYVVREAPEEGQFAQATERSPQWVKTLRRMVTARESGTTDAMCVIPCAVRSRSLEGGGRTTVAAMSAASAQRDAG